MGATASRSTSRTENRSTTPCGPRHGGGLRRRLRDVGQPRRRSRNAAHHEPRRQDRHARHSARHTAIDWNQVIFKGLVIKGIYGREMFETWYKMSSMLQSGLDVRPVITHRLGINDYREGFEIMNSGKSGKVILDWAAL